MTDDQIGKYPSYTINYLGDYWTHRHVDKRWKSTYLLSTEHIQWGFFICFFLNLWYLNLTGEPFSIYAWLLECHFIFIFLIPVAQFVNEALTRHIESESTIFEFHSLCQTLLELSEVSVLKTLQENNSSCEICVWMEIADRHLHLNLYFLDNQSRIIYAYFYVIWFLLENCFIEDQTISCYSYTQILSFYKELPCISVIRFLGYNCWNHEMFLSSLQPLNLFLVWRRYH